MTQIIDQNSEIHVEETSAPSLNPAVMFPRGRCRTTPPPLSRRWVSDASASCQPRRSRQGLRRRGEFCEYPQGLRFGSEALCRLVSAVQSGCAPTHTRKPSGSISPPALPARPRKEPRQTLFPRSSAACPRYPEILRSAGSPSIVGTGTSQPL
jgi:hypothetical protein